MHVLWKARVSKKIDRKRFIIVKISILELLARMMAILGEREKFHAKSKDGSENNET